jgi:predicted nucleic acid-binding protein
MMLWDADAISRGMREPDLRGKVIQAMLRGEIRISAHTVVELSVGKPSEEAAMVLGDLLARDAQLELPTHSDFRDAGRRLAKQPSPKGAKGEKKDARLRLTMDAILAAVAWGRGWSVVTYNKKDFLRLQEDRVNEKILSPDAIWG